VEEELIVIRDKDLAVTGEIMDIRIFLIHVIIKVTNIVTNLINKITQDNQILEIKITDIKLYGDCFKPYFKIFNMILIYFSINYLKYL